MTLPKSLLGALAGLLFVCLLSGCARTKARRTPEVAGQIGFGGYPAALLVPYNDHGRWGLADTLGRVLVAASFDSVEIQRRTGTVRTMRDGKTGLVYGAPPRMIAPAYDSLVATGYLGRGRYEGGRLAYVLARDNKLDLIGPSGLGLVGGAAEVVLFRNFPSAYLVAEEAGGAYRLYDTLGQLITEQTYLRYGYDQPAYDIEKPDDMGRTSVELVVDGTVSDYLGASGLWRVDKRSGGLPRQRYRFPPPVRRIEAAEEIYLPSIEVPPPPPPAPPSVLELGGYTGPPPRLSFPEDTLVTLPAVRREPADLNGGYPNLADARRQLTLPPPPPLPGRQYFDSDEDYARAVAASEQSEMERGAREAYAERLLARTMQAYRADSASRTQRAFDSLGVLGQGRVVYTRGPYGRERRADPILVVAETRDGPALLNRETSRVHPLALDTVTDVMRASIISSFGPGAQPDYLVAGRIDGRAYVYDERGRRLLKEGYDRVELDADSYLLYLHDGGKVGVWLPNTTYPAIAPRYDAIAPAVNLPVSRTWSFGLFEVEVDGRAAYVGENGVEYFK